VTHITSSLRHVVGILQTDWLVLSRHFSSFGS